MKLEALETAMDEATRFLAKAYEVKNYLKVGSPAYITGSKETGACKRASLDLTRALAELRKS